MADAIEMLREDHRKVQELFEQFENAQDNKEKRQIAETALHEIEIHTTLEEEIFYPAAREEIAEEEMDKAEEEHHLVELLASELEKAGPQDKRFSAKFKVLAESVKHHIEEEESTLIPQIEDSLDAAKLGERMAERKEELLRQTGDRSSRNKRKRSTAIRVTGKRSTGRKKTQRRSRAAHR
ncbi:MAG: hemerythrin domain-containing protein [Deltaproteobacteria bacterium]|nr:hemerythrin domain-containing protein [Deltaproteobacteria bacterium]